MKSKQEVIQEAYGEYWPEIEKDIVQECYICLINEHSTLVSWNDILMISHKTDNHLYMPAQLKGIETNNGWTRIESEEDLPKEEQVYLFNESTHDMWIGFLYNPYGYFAQKSATHYQPIIKPEDPIY